MRLHPDRAHGHRGHRAVPAGRSADHPAERARHLRQPAGAGAAAGPTALRHDGILCDGSTNPGPAGTSQAYTNVFTVVPPAAGVPGKLLCTLNDNPTPVALVSGVQGLSIYYGVKRNPGVTDYNVDTYLTADQMLLAGPNGNDWGNISSVRVILTFTNPLAGQPGQQPIVFERVIEVMARAGVHT
ncbi:MAG: hypothetical protein E6K34_17900 [Gammaproteobacteria bacterium]|nr:MAG: hypothetical protein E6K34_17900 [Gammaproteobacteria bacterium]